MNVLVVGANEDGAPATFSLMLVEVAATGCDGAYPGVDPPGADPPDGLASPAIDVPQF